MSSPELGQLLKGDLTQFFIVRIEDMYRLVQGPVPASRSTGHTFIYITEGEAVMKIGSKQYRTRRDELLMVPAGQVTGKSPTRWIDEIILSEAKTLLRQTSFSVSQVAREVGFEDPSYFARLFRKYEGVTPIQFRDGIEKC